MNIKADHKTPAQLAATLDLRSGSRSSKHIPKARKGTRSAAKARAFKEYSNV